MEIIPLHPVPKARRPKMRRPWYWYVLWIGVWFVCGFVGCAGCLVLI